MAKKPQKEVRLPTATKADFTNLILDATENERRLNRQLGSMRGTWRQGRHESPYFLLNRLWDSSDIQLGHLIRSYDYARALRTQMYRDEKDVVAVANHLVRLADKMDKRDKEIKKVLKAVKAWMKEYQPILEKAKRDQSIIGRVAKV